VDPVEEWLDNLLDDGHNYDHVGANTYAQEKGSMTQETLFQDFDRTSSFERVTSKESQKEVQPHPQRYRSWSINELMAVAGPTHQRGQVGVVPEGGVASVGGQQPDIYANQQQQQQQQQQEGALNNASGQNWMGDSANPLTYPLNCLVSLLFTMMASQADSCPHITPIYTKGL
jgi:hypothetical protein